MSSISKAKWIIDPDFKGLTPINIFRKQNQKANFPIHREDIKNRHTLFRKTFLYSAQKGKARIKITGDDYYKLYINGTFIGQGPAPAYYFNYNYNIYDITPHLIDGENVIAVHVYYQGIINRVWNSGDLRQGMIAEISFEDGSVAATDDSWKCKVLKAYSGGDPGPYRTQYPENIDARLYDYEWREVTYNDFDWEYACVNENIDYTLVEQSTPPLMVYEIKPQTVTQVSDGHFLLDFGHEITGQLKFEASGLEGDTVIIRCAEELAEEKDILKDGSLIKHKMRCICNYNETWTLSGRKFDILEHYDYKAFRYAEVIAKNQVVNQESFCAIVRHYPLDEEKCTFKTSDRVLGAVWEICSNGVKYGSQEGYLDCPSREKGQYLGDSTVISHSHVYISGDLRLYKKMIKDFALSSFICPGLMAVAPGSFMQEIADYSLQWPMQLLTYYRQSGDIEFLKEMLPIAEGIITYFKKFAREDGLLENVHEKWNLVDWPQNLRDNYEFREEGCHNVINAFYYGAICNVIEIKNILGIDTGKPDSEREALKHAFLKTFYISDSKLFRDSEESGHCALHSNVLPLLFKIAPDEAIASIVEMIRQKGFSCGVYMSYFVLKSLAQAGAYDVIYSLITSEDIHSWGNMIKEGATTCFEAWGKEQKQNTSLCHAWASSPIAVIVEDIVGLYPKKPGWAEIGFTPHIPDNVSELTLEIEVPTGKVRVEHLNGITKLYHKC